MYASILHLLCWKLFLIPDPKIFEDSKNFLTYRWNIPQTQNQQFMKGFL